MTDHFSVHPEGWHILAPGRYAVLGSPRNDYSVEHPDAENVFVTEAKEEGLALVVSEDIPFLVASFGADRSGGLTRTVEVDGTEIVTRGFLAISPVSASGSPRQNPYASSCDLYVFIDVTSHGAVTMDDDGISIIADGRLIQIDPWRPASFDFEGICLDMDDEKIASALGYGSDNFQGSVDEHGILLDLPEASRRLREGGATEVADRLQAVERQYGLFYHR